MVRQGTNGTILIVWHGTSHNGPNTAVKIQGRVFISRRGTAVKDILYKDEGGEEEKEVVRGEEVMVMIQP